MTTLLIFMAVDYMSGFAVAGIFKKSPKTERGTLNSDIGFRGLAKKGMMLAVVLIANRVDMILNTSFCRDGVIIAFIVNETISIIENAGAMGVPVPSVIKKAIELLNNKKEDV
jgi:toxin secretion/phage lysis holin